MALHSRGYDSEMAEFVPGMRVAGVVSRVADFGVFLELHSSRGFVALHEMTWGARIGHPRERFAVGDEVTAVVLKVSSDMPYVALGIKQLRPDPWADASVRYPEGSDVPGFVISNADYGVFVSIEEEIEGLVHVSELRRSDRPAVGEGLTVRILSFDLEERRLTLGIPGA